MTTLITIVFLWWLAGCAGMAAIVYFSDDDDDITIRSVIAGMGYAMVGPILWILIAMYWWDQINFTPLGKWWNSVMDIKLTDKSKPKKVKAEKPKKEEVKFTNHKPTYDRMQEIKNRKTKPSEEATLKSNLLED